MVTTDEPGTCISCTYPKAVHVSRYTRWRFNRTEYVREHCRSYPGQLQLFR